MERSKITSENIFQKTTKISLVVYCLISLVGLIVCLTISPLLNNYTYLWGFLLCLGPGILFIFVSCLLPFERIVSKTSSKGMVAWFVIAYIFKYLLVIGIPIIGIVFKQYFNRWTMLAMTVVAPIEVIVVKIIIANIVSKKNKTNEEKPKNTIKF